MPITGTKTSVASKTPSTASKTSTAATDAAPKTNVASRAPWLKDAGKTTSTTQAPWSKRNATAADSNGTQKEVKLQSREVKVPVVTQRKTSIPTEPLVKPKPKDIKVTVPEDNYETSSSEYEEVTDSEEEEEETEEETESSSEEDDDENKHKMPIQVKLKPVEKPAEVKKSPSVDRAALIPPPPPPPKMVPPPPPPPGLTAPKEFVKKEISNKGKETLEKLKSRPRRRPDWSDMMKEVESGKKLRHVECNDRSNPILKSETITKVNSGQFVFESEKANVHNALLKQIQFGIKLKATKTDDRSKPVLGGLRKFRKQMTIEEQIQKSESRAQLGQAPEEQDPIPDSADEMDDIDKLRDDLQSTKQMLAQELRNKEAQDRENKRLLAKIQNLEAELTKSKSGDGEGNGEGEKASSGGDNEALIKSLKSEAEEAQNTSKLLEKKYQDAAGQLDAAKSELEEQKRKIAELEKKFAQSQENNTWCSSCGCLKSINIYDKGIAPGTHSRRQSEVPVKETSPEPDFESSGEDDDLDDEQKAARVKRRLNREVKYLKNKLDRLKDKQQAATKERQAIRESMKKNQVVLKDEKKKFKSLQREVDKMAALMKDDDDEDAEPKDDEDNEADEKEESEAEESESEESESGESGGSDDESVDSEPEDAEDEKKKANYEPRIKRHEGRLAALKKGNLLHQTNLDRLIDEINRMRDESVTLQHDLDSVLSELG
ncbi:bromo and FHA domain-containing protein DDB_G0267958 isoform X4 [Sitodiplosis mosellana]|uniref:bromo and FHA domain-containing protein DDB_G0267958 isoform X4 n=1 Tax=Sitodiplosis mosellana TaxID=263140 RepID=UPI00244453B9|nr:bromo and FHA domain-containing protein DDB_G0267958 isoform X4 [Sitodiplosis mosellana]